MTEQIRFDFTNMTDAAVGEHGIPDSLVESLEGRALDIDSGLRERREHGEFPYRDLPNADASAIIDYAAGARKRFTSFVNVGIGGSALGAQALVMALCHPFHNLLPRLPGDGMRMFFADNIDPDQLAGIFDVCEPETTLCNIITKSGSTAETMGTFLPVKAWLEAALGDRWTEHVVVTTDAEKGDLRRIAAREHLESFIVPDGVGGRFSVLCPVGLLPAACAGIDIRALLAGAAAMDKRLDTANVMDNPAYLYAMYQYLLDVKLDTHISVMMPYSSGLYGMADWYRQIWAESLGKKFALDGSIVHTGPTPVKALGVTDQHSQVQLYVEGPFDKVFTFLEVTSFSHELPMTAAYPGTAALDYLGGRSMAELMEAELKGTIHALKASGRPSMTVTFPAVTPETAAQFMYALEVATVFSGGLYGINPLDQPGVEGGKIAAFALMGRPGYENRAGEITGSLTSNESYVK